MFNLKKMKKMKSKKSTKVRVTRTGRRLIFVALVALFLGSCSASRVINSKGHYNKINDDNVIIECTTTESYDGSIKY